VPHSTEPPAAPNPHIGTPEDIARAVLFLVEPAAGYITGQSIAIDGGTVLR